MEDYFYIMQQSFLRIDYQCVYIISHRYFHVFHFILLFNVQYYTSSSILHDFSVQRLDWSVVDDQMKHMLFEDIHSVLQFVDLCEQQQHHFTSIDFSFVFLFNKQSILQVQVVQQVEYKQDELKHNQVGLFLLHEELLFSSQSLHLLLKSHLSAWYQNHDYISLLNFSLLVSLLVQVHSFYNNYSIIPFNHSLTKNNTYPLLII